ncbi:hypothetical protein BC936DRAFT_142369 [Jimgerdemannia flammicorona]|uniref:Uncharacterized protein n=1 Tax=Jimgerdemannia flammicorona TaxID=994334 RepID=A0A433DFA3_9FUNG|nr:hypothetical protein BC936DRAFT_142369 [Jimgerdemannia flammicorona]
MDGWAWASGRKVPGEDRIGGRCTSPAEFSLMTSLSGVNYNKKLLCSECFFNLLHQQTTNNITKASTTTKPILPSTANNTSITTSTKQLSPRVFLNLQAVATAAATYLHNQDHQ